MIQLIKDLFERYGMARYADHAEAFATLYSELLLVNESMNLTAITDPEGVIVRHFIDSLTVVDKIPQNATVIDVGCGGGFPTLPLAIVRPDLTLTALDSTAKKLTFVDRMAKKLSLRVTTLAARAEEIPAYRESFDVCVSRAVARMHLLTELCLPQIKVGGIFIAMKAQSGEEELREALGGIEKLGGRVVATDAFTLADAGERYLITVEKITPTPAAYPRPWGKIKKKPLS
ncbi:MAG: 16S rRNA (guanine(527)-N(7))-methyltransferase RsmG [Clostridia bacterium]|nr:16S rRNA (guanine(527)-N(7))-methyltransferase RsmG [Clostridia bacterium]